MLSINKFIVLAFAALCGSMVNAQNTVMRTPVSVWLTAAPLGDCRQQYYQLAVDNSTQLSYLCNESSGAWTAASLAAGLSITAGKTLTATNTLTLSGTDGTVETFPTTSATIARTDAAQTFTGVQTLSSAPVLSTGTITNTGTETLPSLTGTIPVMINCGPTTGTTTCANTASASGTVRVLYGVATLASNTAVISGISPAFAATTSFSCTGNDITTRANPVQVISTSTSSITITNTTGAADVINYVCVGY